MRALIVVAIVAGAAIVPAAARGFHLENDFARSALEAGGGGMYYTGSPSSNGYDCTVCHTEADRRMYLTLNAEPPGLVVNRRYQPNVTYQVEVEMQSEHRGLDNMNNNFNTFVFEVVDDSGENVGTFGATDPGCRVFPDAEVVVARGARTEKRWSFEWVAPGEGAGPATIHLVGVDGDGFADRMTTEGDPFNDDVYVGELTIHEEGAAIPAEPGDAGCSAVPGPPGGAGAWLVLVLVCWGVGRRKWVVALTIAIALVAAACGGGEEGGGDPPDCTRTICAPDAGDGTRDAGDRGPPDAGARDDAAVFVPDAGDAVDGGDAGPPAPDAGPRCVGDPIRIAGAERFCRRSCYCGVPEACFGRDVVDVCCEDTPLCPPPDSDFAVCLGHHPIVGDGTRRCPSGQCLCIHTDLCFSARTADACCPGRVMCP